MHEFCPDRLVGNPQEKRKKGKRKKEKGKGGKGKREKRKKECREVPDCYIPPSGFWLYVQEKRKTGKRKKEKGKKGETKKGMSGISSLLHPSFRFLAVPVGR